MTNPPKRSVLHCDQSVSQVSGMPRQLKKCGILIPLLLLILSNTFSASIGVTIHPKYLVPVDPNDRAYEQAIEKLLDGRQGRGTMIYTESPYAEGDFVISAWGKDRSDQDADHPLHNFLTLIKVSPGNPGEAILKDEVEIPIDAQLAMSIEKAWTAVIMRTRYPDDTYLGLDGWRTEFSVFVRGLGTLYGQLWSPSKGLPKELMDMGCALSDYVKASATERIPMRKKLIQSLDDLSTRNLQERSTG